MMHPKTIPAWASLPGTLAISCLMGLLAGIIMPVGAQSGTNGSPGAPHLQSLKSTAAPTGDGPAYPVDFTYSVALDHEPRMTRRDPSDVIRPT